MEENTIINDIVEHVINMINQGDYFGEKPKQSDIAHYLEQADGSACSLPLDYNLFSYKHFETYIPVYLESIDEFLQDFENATGEGFVVHSLGELLWSAIEWYANELAHDSEFYDRLEKETGVAIERDAE